MILAFGISLLDNYNVLQEWPPLSTMKLLCSKQRVFLFKQWISFKSESGVCGERRLTSNDLVEPAWKH